MKETRSASRARTPQLNTVGPRTIDRRTALAAELVDRRVSVIATGLATSAALAAMNRKHDYPQCGCDLLRCICRFLARTGPPAMSAIRSLSGETRTWHRQPNSVEKDRDCVKTRLRDRCARLFSQLPSSKRLPVQSIPISTKSRWKFYAQGADRSFHTVWTHRGRAEFHVVTCFLAGRCYFCLLVVAFASSFWKAIGGRYLKP